MRAAIIRAIGADVEIQNQVVAQMRASTTKQLEELQTNRRQLERQRSRDHAEIGKLAVLHDPTGATSARIADLHVRITKCEIDLKELLGKVRPPKIVPMLRFGTLIDRLAVAGWIETTVCLTL